jgi:hypothetical protein
MNRRFFIQSSAAAALAAESATLAGVSMPPTFIDTNVWLGRWPFRRSPLDEPPALAAKLHSQGITRAWAGNLDALFYKDIPAVNNRTAEACAEDEKQVLSPVAALNPKLPGWREELRRCAEVHRMRILRLHPNYHGYTLAEPLAAEVLQLASSLDMLVQIPLIMEDERTIHPLVNVQPVDPAPLPELMQQMPKLRVHLLNAFRTLRGLPVKSLASRGISFEIATLEGIEGIANLLKDIPVENLCFGSYSPVFILESSLLKLRESELKYSQLAALRSYSATAL